MAVKYRVLYKDMFNQQCRIDISPKADYSGPIKILTGVSKQACVLERDCDDDPYTTIIPYKASINVYQTKDLPIDIYELQSARDRDFIVEVFIDDLLKFKGFLIPDGIEQKFRSAPYTLTLNATDGIMLLNDLNYTHNNLTGGRCVLNYLRQILFSNNNLGLALPIRWVNKLKNQEYPLEADVFSGSITWAPRGEGFTDYNGNVKSCLYILEGILKSMQCRLVQSDGRWEILRINDIHTGSYSYFETPATLDGFEVNAGPIINTVKNIGGINSDYKFINEDAVLTASAPFSRVQTTYNQDQRDNIIPNGNMDLVSFSQPIYWTLRSDTTNTAIFESAPSLSKSAGYSVEITNGRNPAPIPTSEARFELQGSTLPIDSDVLYTYINFGFKFSILNGATLDPDGYIVWESTPFKVRLWYFAGTITYFLNENGFWTTTDTEIQITVAKLKLNDVAQIDFNAKQNIILPLPQTTPIERSPNPSLYISFSIPPGRKILLDDIYFNTDSNSDVYEAEFTGTTNTNKGSYDLNISSSHNGFYVSNFMTQYDKSGLEKFYSDGKFTGTLTAMNSNAIMRNRYKSSLIFDGSMYGKNYSYTEIYNINNIPDKNFMPLRTSFNTETNTIQMRCIETRDDNPSLSMNHYGSNDKTKLSN